MNVCVCVCVAFPLKRQGKGEEGSKEKLREGGTEKDSKGKREGERCGGGRVGEQEGTKREQRACIASACAKS